MFGDIGHGLILMSVGVYLVKRTCLEARFLIFLMGFFAFYSGLIYNDYLSIPLNLFESCYSKGNNTWTKAPSCVYPFGIDPVWAASSNSINFINPFKIKVFASHYMKQLSVIVGVTHMLFGIALKGCNAVFFKNPVDFCCEVVP